MKRSMNALVFNGPNNIELKECPATALIKTTDVNPGKEKSVKVIITP